MKEIVTIQVGGFANYIGSHFWNFQDELLGLAGDPQADYVFKNSFLDMDVLYRTGETPQGILTYTPRLVSIDFQGMLGSLRSSGSLYNELPSSDPSHVVTWTGDISRHVSEPCKKNPFLQSLDKEEHEKLEIQATHDNKKDLSGSQDKDRELVHCLDKDVQFWTDFSKVHFHPRSLYELNSIWMDIQDFDNYGSGKEVLSGSLQAEEMDERLRFFVEDCDHIQGIQFIVDDSGGFSGIAVEFLENIADEYSHTPVLLYSARSPINFTDTSIRRKSIMRALHDAVSLSKLSSLCKLMVPIGLPCLSTSKASKFLSIENGKGFHSSAVYAAALHSISLPFRMVTVGSMALTNVSGAVDIGELTNMLALQGRQNNVAVLDAAMPAPPLTGEQGSIQGNLRALTPEVAEDVEDLFTVESTAIHGALCSGGNQASIAEVKESVDSYYRSSEAKPIFSHLSVARCPLPIPLPFPTIFGRHVGTHGELLGDPVPNHRPKGSLDVHSVPMAARLRSSNAILPFVQKRLTDIQRFGTDRGAPGSEVLKRWGFQKDDVLDMAETLSRMKLALDPHSEVSSDSD